MANISNIQNIVSGDAVLASVVSNNFSQIVVAVNSNALNSQNYGVSSIKSQNIGTGAILSQHIGQLQVGSAKIADGGVVHSKLNFKSSDGGVRLIQVGAAASNMPANGVEFVRVSKTYNLSANPVTVILEFSNGMEGAAGFTASPTVLGEPLWRLTGGGGPIWTIMSAIDSVSCHFRASFAATQAITATVYLGAIGGK